MISWIFPGQGSQKAGMASDVDACELLFSDARNILGTDFEALCTTDLDPSWTPEVVQPALFITSVGIIKSLTILGLSPDAVAGHSLGELAAVVAAGGISFEDGLRLVDLRGKAMASAGRANPGGMAAVLGLDSELIEQICQSEPFVWVANFNSPKQTVISGSDDSLSSAAEKCLEAGAKRVVRLQVPMASHCPLMDSARSDFEAALEKVSWNRLSCPMYCGADGQAHEDPAQIRKLLAQALTTPVRFVGAVTNMQSAGITSFVETGPGRVLRGLVKQIDAGAHLASASNDSEIAALAEQLSSRAANVTS